MTTTINSRIRKLWVSYWIARALWNQQAGRWFYWRDVPDVVVRMISSIPEHKITRNETELSSAISDAKAEWMLRAAIRRRGWVTKRD